MMLEHRATVTVGTHNLLDGAGRVTPFADVILYTEAPLTPLELSRHTVARCREQRDLAVAWLPDVFTATDVRRYWRAHPGVARVTPHRGTYAVEGEMVGRPAVLIVEHRINAAFPPYRRGEALFRRTSWWWHTRLTQRIIRRYRRRGWLVIAGGDVNTPAHVDGYPALPEEVGAGLDRIACTEPLRVSGILGFGGSDHRRLRAVLRLPA